MIIIMFLTGAWEVRPVGIGLIPVSKAGPWLRQTSLRSSAFPKGTGVRRAA